MDIVNQLQWFSGRVNTTLRFYPIVQIKSKRYALTKWKLLSDGRVLVFDKHEHTSRTSRMSEWERLEGMVTDSMRFIND